MPTTVDTPFSLPRSLGPLRRLAEHALGLDRLARRYRQWQALRAASPPQAQSACPRPDFLSYTAASLRLSMTGEVALLSERVPPTGPLLVVSNHPMGAAEGIALAHALRQIRPDLKVLTNHLLLRIPELADCFIGVDNLRKDAQSENVRALRQVSNHLQKDGCLLIFPAGTVGNWSWRDGRVQDGPWHDMVGRLALRHRAPCLPVYIEGQNQRSFYLSGLVHPRLRTALLAKAVLTPEGRRMSLRVGQVMRVHDGMAARAATDLMRLSCELLAPQRCRHSAKTSHCGKAIIPAVAKTRLEQDMESLQAYQVLQRGSYAVYCAPYAALGSIAEHMSREREQTFRLAGEGTGKLADVDRYDHSHEHVLVWDHAANQLVGGYRVAAVRPLVERHGIAGLYTASMFHIKRGFLRHLGGAVEVGRSFVTPAYQGDMHALDLLWMGLGSYINRHPDCHTFFGCVSISSSYAPLLRLLLADTLMSRYATDHALRRTVRPSVLFNGIRRCWSSELGDALGDISAVNKLFGRIDPSLRVPVLIRHYINLHGRFVDFTVDEVFNKSLDGLVVVDLRQTPDRYLRRYLGEAAAAAMRAHWQVRQSA